VKVMQVPQEFADIVSVVETGGKQEINLPLLIDNE
jgi:hypothetical protein